MSRNSGVGERIDMEKIGVLGSGLCTKSCRVRSLCWIQSVCSVSGVREGVSMCKIGVSGPGLLSISPQTSSFSRSRAPGVF